MALKFISMWNTFQNESFCCQHMIWSQELNENIINANGRKRGKPDTLDSVLWLSVDPSHEIQVYQVGMVISTLLSKFIGDTNWMTSVRQLGSQISAFDYKDGQEITQTKVKYYFQHALQMKS